MPDAFACPDAGPIACSIQQVVETLAAGPTIFEVWALLVLPAITTFGTLAALAVSVAVSLSARKQAQESENARQNTELARQSNEREQRLQAALGDFMAEIPEHFEAMRKYEPENLKYQRFTARGGPKVLFAPPKPSTIGLTTRLATAEINATAEEIVFIEALRQAVTWHESKALPHRERCLRAVPRLIVDWMRESDAEQRNVIVETLRDLAASSTEADAKQILDKYDGARVEHRVEG